MAKLTKLKELWVDEESAFGVDPSTDGSGYLKVPMEDGSWTPSQATVERPVQRDALGISITSQAGQKGGTLAFKVPLIGCATPGVASTEAAIDPWLAYLLAACGLVESDGTGTTTTGTGSTTTVLDVTSSAGFAIGHLVMVAGEVRIVTAVGSGVMTVAPALSAAPGNAVVVHGSSSWLVDINPSDYVVPSVAFVFKANGDEETVLGCSGTVTLDQYDAGTRPMLSFSFQVDSFADTTNKTSLPPTFTKRTDLLAMGSPLWWGATKTPVARVGFDPGMVISPRPATQGPQGRIAWALTDENARLTCTPYSAQSTYRADFATPTTRNVVAQVGAVAGGAFAVGMQNGQILDFPAEADVGGVRANDLVIRARAPTVADMPGFVIGFF